MMIQQQILIATLGTEPQVVTTTLDLLRCLPNPISPAEIHILFTATSDPSLTQSLAALRTELSDQSFVRYIPILDVNGKPADNLDSREEINGFFQTIYSEIRNAKNEGFCVHLLCSGGRKIMSMYGMTAAQMLFTEEDHLWYLSSRGAYLTERKMHPHTPTDFSETQLIPLPVLTWSSVSPILSETDYSQTPFEALRYAQTSQLTLRANEARIFYDKCCTAAERRMIDCLIPDGKTNAEIAEQLCLSERTVETHLARIFSKAAAHWGIESINRTRFVALTQAFYLAKYSKNTVDKSSVIL